NVIPLDIRCRHEVFRVVTKIRPDVIVHTAALTDVDYCEEHPDEASILNVEGTRTLVAAAKNIGTEFVYISTDSVFDGKKGMYVEEDVPNPINCYAKTKLEGEKLLNVLDQGYTIIRTCIYGWNMQQKFSLAEWAIHNLQNGQRINMFKDVFFSPILVNNLSEAILEICDRDVQGIINVAGSKRCSKFDFGRSIAKVFDLDEALITPIEINDFKGFKAPRPKDVSLDVSKAKKILHTKLLDVDAGLTWMKELFEEGYVEKLKRCMVRHI
ncbi:MAG: SDR family oxidoreductase, partial [Candidatus Hadarchaeum sp.]